MKKFEIPMMVIQRLNAEFTTYSSDCMVEADVCLSCYCSGVTCEGKYSCDGFECPRYDEI